MNRCLASSRLVLFFTLCALATGAAAQTYPSRPIRLISPNPPGGANDTIGRIVAAKLTDVLGVQLVIDNRGGAGGTLGAEIAAGATPDGYTLLAGSVSTHSFSPALRSKLNYDPVGDFTPISLFAISQNLLVTHPSLPASNVKQLIALAKSRPKALNYASGGTGSTSHYAIALFVHLAGIDKDTVHIPYKGGGPSVAATMAGETQFYFGPMASMVSQVKAGKLKALAVGGTKRSPTVPDVPTVAEAGIPAYQSFGWFGMLAPAKTPKAVIARLNKAVADAVSAPDVTQKFLQLGVDPAHDTPEAFGKFIADQLARYRKTVKDLDIKAGD
ncbi:MAG: tripartite tricarboxylate transporter substrate binding protein [Burkholderiales bacterium]|nr:tripartite tricarboxylate transporter substrate binding protein [Burkholderiales bacterium]